MDYMSTVTLSLLLLFPFTGVVQAAEQSVDAEQVVSSSAQQPSDKAIESTSKKRRVKKRRQKKQITRRQKWRRCVGITGGVIGAIGAAVVGFLGWMLLVWQL